MIQRILFFISLISVLSCAKDARGIMLWEIAHSSLAKPSYLFGTYHSRDKELNKLPPKITRLLLTTQALYTETDLTKKSQEIVQNLMQSPNLLPLKKRLSPSTYKRLQHHIKKSHIPFTEQTLRTYKTWAIAILLTHYNESTTNAQTLFMDERLVHHATQNAMVSLGLETPKEQLSYFDLLSSQEQELLLLDSMNQIEDTQYTKALKEWYVKGEISGFNALQKRFEDRDPQIRLLDEKLFASLLTERNFRFLKRIDTILQNNPQKNFFFAIGAGHLAEDNGLISLLRKKGYRISKID